MLEASQPVAGTLEDRLKRQGLQADDVLLVRDIGSLQAAVDACRADGKESPIIVLRARPLSDEPIEVGDIRLDQRNNLLRYAGREWLLRSKPVSVLAALMRSPGRVIPRESLIQQVWGEFRAEHDATLRVYVHQLRQIIDAGAPRRRHIVTVRATGRRGGYLFRA